MFSCLFFILFLSAIVDAGISLGKGSLVLEPGEIKELCDVWIYATQPGGSYHIEVTGNLTEVVKNINPNDFTLKPINCPEETYARRACITELCLSGNEEYCKIICINFSAPILMSLEPTQVVYDGSILNTIKISSATIKEPYSFSVYVKQVDAKPIVFSVCLVIILLLLTIFIYKKMKKRRK